MRRHLRRWAMLVMAAVVLDLAIFASYFHLVPEEIGRSFSVSFPLSVNNWLMWAAFAPFVLLGARTMAARHWPWGRRMALALMVALALAHLHRSTIAQLERQLDPRDFVRIHRSTMVRLGRVREMQPYFHGEYVVLLHDGTRLKLSRSYREQLQAALGQTL